MTNAVQAGTTLSDRVAMEIMVALTRRRMSQRELARRLQRSVGWINYRLTGQQVINLDDMELIAQALGVEAIDLWPPSDKSFTRQYGSLTERLTDSAFAHHHHHERPHDSRPPGQHAPTRPSRPAALLRSTALPR